jgi:hypothetical protein
MSFMAILTAIDPMWRCGMQGLGKVVMETGYLVLVV